MRWGWSFFWVFFQWRYLSYWWCTDADQSDRLDYSTSNSIDSVVVTHLIDDIVGGSVVQIGSWFRKTQDYCYFQEVRLSEQSFEGFPCSHFHFFLFLLVNEVRLHLFKLFWLAIDLSYKLQTLETPLQLVLTVEIWGTFNQKNHGQDQSHSHGNDSDVQEIISPSVVVVVKYSQHWKRYGPTSILSYQL